MSSGGTYIERNRGARAGVALLVAGLLALAGLAGGAPTADGRGGGCARANATINEGTAKQLAKALQCEINRNRAKRDLPALRANAKLRKAAAKHNKVMIAEDCWSHDCPGEPGLERRIRNTGYLDGAKRWRFAENFGCAPTPRTMLKVWLEKRFQRRNIRSKAFRDVGVAAVRDQVAGLKACDDGDEVTYTVVFAKRTG